VVAAAAVRAAVVTSPMTITTPEAIRVGLGLSQYVRQVTMNDGDHLVPPPRVDFGPDRTLSFRVADEHGRCSSTWWVKTHKSKRDVFLGTRGSNDDMKLSLHGLDCWRIAWTSEAVARDPSLGKRELLGFNPPPEFAPGWRRALSIVVPSTSLMRQVDGSVATGTDKIATWPAPPLGFAIRFDLALSDRKPSDLAVIAVGAVGSVAFTDGGVVAVIGDQLDTSASEELWRQEREALRLHMERESPGSLDPTYVHSVHKWGTSKDGQIPLLLDLGDPTRLSAGLSCLSPQSVSPVTHR
jgi:hypothetical protein